MAAPRAELKFRYQAQMTIQENRMHTATAEKVQDIHSAAPKNPDVKSGDDQPMKIDVVRKNIRELEALFERKQDAASAYSDAVQSVATKSNISKQAVQAFIAARAKDKVASVQTKAAQLTLLFEEVT